MRALSAAIAFALVLVGGGWLTGARAQNVGQTTPPASNPVTNPVSNPAAGDQPLDSGLPLGVIPQPTLENPGVVAGVTLGELYTDNLTLAGDGQSKQSSWITQIQPFIKAAYNRPRVSGLVDYTLTGYLYPGHSDHNQLAQQLNAKGTLTLLPQHIFLDGTAFYGRHIIDNRAPSGSDTFFLNNNTANVAVATISPYWLQDLGRVGSMSLRYTRGRVVYNDRGISGENPALLYGIPNITSDAVQFNLVSPNDQIVGWNLSYSEQRLDPDFGSSLNFAVAKAGTWVQVNDNLRLLADGGRENRFLPDGTVDKLGASFWDAGFEWSTDKNNFKLLGGHRFFGRSYELSWTHHAELLTTYLSYSEQPTTYNQQLLGLDSLTAGLPSVGIRSDIPSLTERQPYLSKRFSASAVYTMPRSTLNVRAYDEQRTYFELGNLKERVADVDVSWLFNVGTHTTLTPSFNWQRYLFRDGQINYNRYAQLALVHQYNRKNFGSLRLRHDTSDVHSPLPGAHGYDANVIFLAWTHLF